MLKAISGGAIQTRGNFTPALVNIGTGTTAVAVGRWTKTGNTVTAYVHLSMSTLGTASGALEVSGLPFTSASTANVVPIGSAVHAYSWINSITGMNARIVPSSAIVQIFSGITTGGPVAPTHADLGGGGNLIFTLTYEAA